MPIFRTLAALVVPLASGALTVLLLPHAASASAATDITAATFITRRTRISFVNALINANRP